jgi:inorganic pyrophosphatase
MGDCRSAYRSYSRAVATDLLSLPPRDEAGAIHVVIESPRGSRVKLKYTPALGAFVLSRPLPLGVTYPHDWGFVPGTRAEDGDPVDALVLLDAATFPGVVVACRPLAVLEVEQNAKQGGRQRNDRIIAAPAEARRPGIALDARVRDELVAFFGAVTLLEGKDLRVLGWGDAEAAEALVDRASRR